jgi:hypothetical protein
LTELDDEMAGCVASFYERSDFGGDGARSSRLRWGKSDAPMYLAALSRVAMHGLVATQFIGHKE